MFEKARSRCKDLLPGKEETLFFAKAEKLFSHLETRVQKYDAEKRVWGGGGDTAFEDGGKLHPHTDAAHTGLVMLTSLGATCEFLVDLAKGRNGCQLQQHGGCWCSDGKHWISKEVYDKQRQLRNKWWERRPVSCPKELCHKRACSTCQVVQMKSGDVLIFDAVDVVHGLSPSCLYSVFLRLLTALLCPRRPTARAADPAGPEHVSYRTTAGQRLVASR